MKQGNTCLQNEHDRSQENCSNCNVYMWTTAVVFFLLGVAFGDNLKIIPWWDFLDIPISLLWKSWELASSRLHQWYTQCRLLLLPFIWRRRNGTDVDSEAVDGEDGNDDVLNGMEDPCDAKRKNWKARQRGTSFAKSIRKFSLLHDNRVSHGLIEAMGEGLEIVSIDPTMRRLLGWPTETMDPSATPSDGGQALPTSVHDLLPENFRSIHRQFLAKAISEGALPSSLMHPLRNVKMLRRDGTSIRVNVCIGLITKDIALSSKECMFYALVSEREDAPPTAERSSSQTENGVQDREDSIASITEVRMRF